MSPETHKKEDSQANSENDTFTNPWITLRLMPGMQKGWATGRMEGRNEQEQQQVNDSLTLYGGDQWNVCACVCVSGFFFLCFWIPGACVAFIQ